MNLDFVTSADFLAYFIMLLAFAFMLMSMWVMHDLDKDDKKNNKQEKPHNHKLKKA